MRTSHSETDPADEYLMTWFDAVVEFQKTVMGSRCGYTPQAVARWWAKGERHILSQHPELLEACSKLESVIGAEDSYWKDPWSES